MTGRSKIVAPPAAAFGSNDATKIRCVLDVVKISESLQHNDSFDSANFGETKDPKVRCGPDTAAGTSPTALRKLMMEDYKAVGMNEFILYESSEVYDQINDDAEDDNGKADNLTTRQLKLDLAAMRATLDAKAMELRKIRSENLNEVNELRAELERTKMLLDKTVAEKNSLEVVFAKEKQFYHHELEEIRARAEQEFMNEVATLMNQLVKQQDEHQKESATFSRRHNKEMDELKSALETEFEARLQESVECSKEKDIEIAALKKALLDAKNIHFARVNRV